MCGMAEEVTSSRREADHDEQVVDDVHNEKLRFLFLSRDGHICARF